jgi:hypothetical protein
MSKRALAFFGCFWIALVLGAGFAAAGAYTAFFAISFTKFNYLRY